MRTQSSSSWTLNDWRELVEEALILGEPSGPVDVVDVCNMIVHFADSVDLPPEVQRLVLMVERAMSTHPRLKRSESDPEAWTWADDVESSSSST